MNKNAQMTLQFKKLQQLFDANSCVKSNIFSIMKIMTKNIKKM
jgi:hypothetical protein